MSGSSLKSPCPPLVSSYTSFFIQLQSHLSEREPHPIRRTFMMRTTSHPILVPNTAEQKDTGASRVSGTSLEAQSFLWEEEMSARFNKTKAGCSIHRQRGSRWQVLVKGSRYPGALEWHTGAQHAEGGSHSSHCEVTCYQ